MAKRVSKADVMVEELLSPKRRISNSKVMVEQIPMAKFRLTKAIIQVEYTKAVPRHNTIPVQVI